MKSKSTIFWRNLLSYVVLSLVPIFILSSVSLVLLEKYVVSKDLEKFSERAQFNSGLINLHTDQLYSITMDMFQNTFFRHTGTKTIYDFWDISTYLRKQKAMTPLIYDLLYVDLYNQKVYASNAIYSYEYLENNLYAYPGKGLIESLSDIQPRRTVTWLPQTTIVQAGYNLELVTMLMPLDSYYSHGQLKLSGCTVFILKKEALDAILESDSQGTSHISLLFDNNRLLYCSNPLLKDEISTVPFQLLQNKKSVTIDGRDYLVFAPKTNHTMISSVTLVDQATAYMARHVVLVSAGIAVLLTLILCSGMIYLMMHINYRPIRSMFLFASPHLKEASGSMNEIEATQFAISSLIRQKDLLVESNHQLLKEQCFSLLLGDQPPEQETLHRQCLLASMQLDGPHFLVLLAGGDCDNACDLSASLKTIWRGNQHIYWQESLTSNQLIILLSDTEENFWIYYDSIKELTNCIRLGTAVHTINEIRASYHVARQSPQGEANQQNAVEPLSYTAIANLQMVVQTSNLERFSLITQEIRARLEHCPHFSQALFLFIDYLLQLLNICRECQVITAQQLLALKSKYYDQPYQELAAIKLSLDELTNDISCILKGQLTGGNLKVESVVTYINTHCFSTSFSLKSMADLFQTTPSNLSHFFKSHTGYSLSSYINGIKIQKAKDLLNQSSIAVAGIADAVGYADTSSFIRKFKSQCGVTPSEYRRVKDDSSILPKG